MPITTYARLGDLLQTTDPDICEVLAELRRAPVVREMPYRRQVQPRGWWHFPLCNRYRLEVGYSVLWHLHETPLGTEWQVMTFYRTDTGTSINTVVPKELVLAYLYGCATRQEDAP